MITLQSWATSRIPVTSEEEFHRGTQHLDNLGRHIGDIAFDDPDLKAAVRRVSTVLGARVLTRHISPHAMGADLSASSVISEDIDWFTDICGDIMFLILHRGVKQAEMEFKAKGGVITTTDLENSDATEVSSNEEQPDSTKDYETAADGSTIRQDLSAQEILKIPPYLRKVYRNARRRISTASSKSWDIDITDNTSSSPESSTTSQETAKRSLLLRSTTSPVGSRLFRTRDSLKQRAAGLILLNRILKKKSGTTESATSFPTTLKTDPNASRPVYYGSSPWKYVPSELLSKSNNGEPEEMDAPVGEILDSLKDAKEAYSTPEPVVFGPELWKAPPKPLPPSHPAPWDNFHALSETTGPEPEPTSESTPGPQSTETTPTKPPIHKSSSPPLPIRRIESKPDPTANQPPFSLSTVQNLDAVLQNLAAAKHTGTYKQKLQFIPTPPANDPTTSTNNQNEPRINFHRTHPPPKTPGDFHQLEEELHEANSQPKDPFAVLKSQMRDLFSSIKPRKPSEGTQGEPSHGEKD
ncbi:uncharacterized protein DFL_006637 [Arthrobotrys flagrans]|uniref:Uncharacterized protein n=1 Tax=Arthrobotrys flagrans TaxID=97331 RepID=A0A436ZTC6_ARTFL|nr:hypothetical protein DFL_006637 [Arthrobotrys flagrans]